jgi:hypothetical protein
MSTSVDSSKTGLGGSVDYAIGEDVNTGSSEELAVTPKALADSHYATEAYVDDRVIGLLDLRAAFDASVNTFPSAGGSGSAGAILKGDLYPISVAGTLGGESLQVGDAIFALVDSPGQTAGNWSKLNSNISYVPERSIDAASEKTTPVDADTLGAIDSAAGNILKKVTWANIKATLKTYFDTLYAALNSVNFNPTLITSGGSGIPAYNQRWGSSRLIGNNCELNLRIWLQDKGGMQAGNLTVGGFPVAAVNTTGANQGFGVHIVNTASLSPSSFIAFIAPGASVIGLFKVSGTGIAALTLADIGSDAVIVLWGSYATS